MNPFEILGLKNNATIAETKRHFRKISLQLHPDKGGTEEQYTMLLDAYKQILDGYTVEIPVYKPRPKENNSITSFDIFITLDEGFAGCTRNIYLNNEVINISIPKGILPMQSVQYPGCGEKNADGIRGILNITIKFIMPGGFTFERYLVETVLVYSVKFRNVPKEFTITVNNKTKKIRTPSKVYNGMFLKVKDFGYINGGIRQPLYVRLSIV